MRILFLLVLLCLPLSVKAAPTVSCHCFQERQYQPQQSHAADSYFLATTQNSLMAARYGVEKKTLVRAKMSGRGGDELWIAHELAARSGRTLAAVEGARSTEGSWAEAADRLGIEGAQLGAEFQQLLSSPPQLAEWIVDDLLTTRLAVSREALTQLQRQGAGAQERILAVLLARVGQSTPVGIYARVLAGESWGKLLFELGLIDAAAIAQTWQQLLQS